MTGWTSIELNVFSVTLEVLMLIELLIKLSVSSNNNNQIQRSQISILKSKSAHIWFVCFQFKFVSTIKSNRKFPFLLKHKPQLWQQQIQSGPWQQQNSLSCSPWGKSTSPPTAPPSTHMALICWLPCLYLFKKGTKHNSVSLLVYNFQGFFFCVFISSIVPEEENAQDRGKVTVSNFQ